MELQRPEVEEQQRVEQQETEDTMGRCTELEEEM